MAYMENWAPARKNPNGDPNPGSAGSPPVNSNQMKTISQSSKFRNLPDNTGESQQVRFSNWNKGTKVEGRPSVLGVDKAVWHSLPSNQGV